MKFKEILKSIQSAWREVCAVCLRLIFPKRHPIRDEVKDIKSDESNDKSNGQTLEDPPKTPEQSPQKPPDSSESSGAAKDEISETQADLSKEETPPPLDSPPLPSRKKPEPKSENGQNKDSQKGSKPGDIKGKRDKDKPNQTTEDGNRPAKPRPPQCRFVCYEEGDGRWTVAVAIEAGQDACSVRQGDNKLSANGGRYILEDIAAEVTVKFKGEHPSKTLKLLNRHKFAVFKMWKNWQGEGQKVNTLFSGDYVVFAHKSCGKRRGKAPIEAEQCRYDDFMAHFFSVSEESERDGFENCFLPSWAKRFSLKGQRFPDDSDLGELFGDDAPQLDDAEEWRHLTTHAVNQNEDGTFAWTFDNYARSSSPYPFNEADAEEIWGRVRMPTLLISGLESAGDPAKDERTDSFPQARKVGIANAGHWVHHDQLGEFLSAVDDFLSS